MSTKTKQLKTYALIDTELNEVVYVVNTRDEARNELRLAKQQWGDNYKIGRMSLETFVR